MENDLKKKIIGNNKYVKDNFDFVIRTSTASKIRFTADNKYHTVNLGDIFINNDNKNVARVIIIDESLYNPIQIKYSSGSKEWLSTSELYKKFELLLQVAQ